MNKIYTRKGDKGETSVTNRKLSKSDPLIRALGALDELNAALGMSLCWHPDSELEEIQQALFDLGANLSGSKAIKKDRFDAQAVLKLEQSIDKMEEQLKPLKTFILPGGHPASAALHLARTICRRAELEIVPLKQGELLIFLNRLSDYLFVKARLFNSILQKPELEWKPHRANGRET